MSFSVLLTEAPDTGHAFEQDSDIGRQPGKKPFLLNIWHG